MQIAEISKFSQEQSRHYENSLKYYRDLKNSMDTAFEKGREEGLIESIFQEKIQTAQRLKVMGLAINMIIEATGLTVDEIDKL